MKKRIAIIKGDGIGPEITQQAIKLLRSIESRFEHTFELVEVEMGACAIDKYGVPITDEALKICQESDAILLGAIGDPKYDNDPSLKVRPEQGLLKLRKTLGLFSNIRPVEMYPKIGASSPLRAEVLEGVDLVIYRELIGGIYFGEKHLSDDGTTATDTCTYTTEQIEQITRQAFESARLRRNKVTLVDKANVLETSRLWRRRVTEIAKEYPDVTLDFLFVDNAAMQLVQAPASFDVLLTENMFGDILSDLASVLTGSIGMLPSASLGNKNGLFEPIHGSYPQAKGKDIANPCATILSVAMMMDYFGLIEEAKVIRDAVQWIIAEDLGTPDIQKVNPYGCEAVGDFISAFAEENEEIHINHRNTRDAAGIVI